MIALGTVRDAEGMAMLLVVIDIMTTLEELGAARGFARARWAADPRLHLVEERAARRIEELLNLPEEMNP